MKIFFTLLVSISSFSSIAYESTAFCSDSNEPVVISSRLWHFASFPMTNNTSTSHSPAAKYCEALIIQGRKFRLPTVGEVLTIVGCANIPQSHLSLKSPPGDCWKKGAWVHVQPGFGAYGNTAVDLTSGEVCNGSSGTGSIHHSRLPIVCVETY